VGYQPRLCLEEVGFHRQTEKTPSHCVPLGRRSLATRPLAAVRRYRIRGDTPAFAGQRVGEQGSLFFVVVTLRKELSVDSDIIWEEAD
jgi:hypothetical protein